MSSKVLGLLSLPWLLSAAAQAHAASVPLGFVDHQVAAGLTSPSALSTLPDGRVLVVQQNGVIRLIQGDTMAPQSFWQVPNVDSSGERGCLGITPDPAFSTNHQLYVYCTIMASDGTSNNRVLRVTEEGGRAVAGSDQLVLKLPPVTSTWHMGGALRFGLDGKLYIAVGNHEDTPQPVATANSQNLTNPFGKILRVNASGSVPSDNPFVGTDAYPAIWSYGYRNPFSFDIQPGTGLILVGDVGQSTWEEIDTAQRGADYGWPEVEGPSDNTRYTPPLYAYNHDTGGCSITGGVFYNPATAQFPQEFVGKFLWEDYCLGTINVLDSATKKVTPFVSGISYPTNLAVSADGSVYYLARHDDAHEADGLGTLSKLTYTASPAPRIALDPISQSVVIGGSVTFTVAVDGADHLQWQRDGVDIPGATGTSYTLVGASLSDNGASFQAVASNASGSTASAAAVLKVSANQPPVAQITGPLEKLEYAPGDTLSFTASASDVEDGALPASAFTWQVDFQHDTHAHPLLAATSGSNTLTFTVPDFEATDANTWVRVHLTAVDSAGASHSVIRDVFPATQLSSYPALTPVLNGYGPVELDKSNGEDAAGDGRELSIAGMPFPKGLGVAAPSDLRFDLAGRCSGRFLADVGVDDEVGDNGSVVFQVYLDDVLAFDSGVLRGSDPRTNVSVDVAGKGQLHLVVTTGGDDNSYDHADWAAARVTGCGQGAAGQLTVFDSDNAADWSIQHNLQLGDRVYGDRAFTFTQIPAAYLGATWVRTANDSKWFAAETVASLVLPKPTDVVVAINDLGTPPSWLDATWSNTGAKLGTLELPGETRSYSAYQKSFPAGALSLRWWVESSSMYIVILPGLP